MNSMRPRREPFTGSELAAALFAMTLLLGGPWARSAAAETMFGVVCTSLLTFDSTDPGTIRRAIQVFPENSRCLGFIDVDPMSGSAYASWYYPCHMLCPPSPYGVVRIDPESGETTEVWSSAADTPYAFAGDFDVDRTTGEVRGGGYPFGYNLHIDVSLGVMIADTAFSPFREVAALAYAPGGEAYVLAWQSGPPYGLDLLRLGGAGGVPPASSGELTMIASIPDIQNPYAVGFDISPAGVAYVSTPPGPTSVSTADSPRAGRKTGEGGPTRQLYRLDLATGAATALGGIPSDGEGAVGIAVAGARGAIAIPALERGGAAALAVLLAAAGAWLLARRRTA